MTTSTKRPKGLLTTEQCVELAGITTNAWYVAKSSKTNPRPDVAWVDPETGKKFWRETDVKRYVKRAGELKSGRRTVDAKLYSQMVKLKRRGATQVEIAKQLGLSERTVSGYLTGRIPAPTK